MNALGGMSLLAVLCTAQLVTGCASDGSVQGPPASSMKAAAQPRVDTERFVYTKFAVSSLPLPGEAAPIYAEFTGVDAFRPALHNWLQARGYKLADRPGEGIAKLQFAGDYLAEGRFQEAGSVRTGNVDLSKVLGMAGRPPDKERPQEGASAMSQIGLDLAANHHSLQITGGSIAGSFGLQAVVAGLFDVTGLTGWIQRTHGPGIRKDPIQIVNIWVNYTSGDGAVRSSSRIEARYTDPVLAPAPLAGAALDYALSTLEPPLARVGAMK